MTTNLHKCDFVHISGKLHFVKVTFQASLDMSERSIYREIICSGAPGAMAGFVSKTVVAPLDRTKIFFQTHPKENYRIESGLKFLMSSYKQDGLSSLWRGNSAAIARVIPLAALTFTFHEQYKKLLGVASPESKKCQKPLRHFLAGAAAGMTGQSLTYPLDGARAIMAVTKVGQYPTLFYVFHNVIRCEGMYFIIFYKKNARY